MRVAALTLAAGLVVLIAPLLAVGPAHADPAPPALGAAVHAHLAVTPAGCMVRLVEVPDPHGRAPIHAAVCDSHSTVLATTGGAR